MLGWAAVVAHSISFVGVVILPIAGIYKLLLLALIVSHGVYWCCYWLALSAVTELMFDDRQVHLLISGNKIPIDQAVIVVCCPQMVILRLYWPGNLTYLPLFPDSLTKDGWRNLCAWPNSQ